MSSRRLTFVCFVVSVIVAFSTGCGHLFGVVENDALVEDSPAAVDSISTMGAGMLRERIASRVIQESSEFGSISHLRFRGMPISVFSPTSSTMVIGFALAPEQGFSGSESVLGSRSSVLFFVDLDARQVVEATRYTSDLQAGIRYAESLTSDSQRVIELSNEVIAGVGKSRGLPGLKVEPKRECDESLTYPLDVWYCMEWVDAYYDQPEFDGCIGTCTSLIGNPVILACVAVCHDLYWHRARCVDIRWETIYPCDW